MSWKRRPDWNDPCNLPPDVRRLREAILTGGPVLLPPVRIKVRGTVDKMGQATREAWRVRLVKKYGAVCWLCCEPIDLELKHPDPLSFTRDHVRPRCDGGRNTLANQRPAHRICNMRRGNRPPPERTEE